MVLRSIHFVAYISISFVTFKNCYMMLKGYFPFTVITKHWLYFPSCKYILEPILHPTVCASHSANAQFPVATPTGEHWPAL